MNKKLFISALFQISVFDIKKIVGTYTYIPESTFEARLLYEEFIQERKTAKAVLSLVDRWLSLVESMEDMHTFLDITEKENNKTQLESHRREVLKRLHNELRTILDSSLRPDIENLKATRYLYNRSSTCDYCNNFLQDAREKWIVLFREIVTNGFDIKDAQKILFNASISFAFK